VAFWQKIQREPLKPVSDVTVGDLLDRWLAAKGNLSESRKAGCRIAAANVNARFRDTRAVDVAEQDVKEWLATARMGRNGSDGPASKRKALEAFTGAMQIAVQAGWITADPSKGVKRPKDPAKDARFLTPTELWKLADAAGDDKTMILLMGTTGLRIGEACHLRVGDIDVRRGRVWVASATAKSRKGRDVPVPPSVMALLPVEGRGRTEWLFTSSRGTRVDENNWRHRHFAAAVATAKLGKVTPHDLRHTAASLAIRSGADVKAVQAMLGHASAKLSLDLYGHLWDQGLDDVARRMDGLIDHDTDDDGGE